jgi:acetyl-CoA synthetase
MRFGDEIPAKYDLSSLKVLGSVGEPINPEAWRWYYENIGHSKCTVVDTYWQTETGGHMITNIPGVTPMKPGSCTLPMYGIDPVVLDAQTGEVIEGNDVEGVLAIRQPWPGMARTCLGDHQRFMATYLTQYPGLYFTGDTVFRDKDGEYTVISAKLSCRIIPYLAHVIIIHEGFIFVTGRCDDVLNVSGHRIGTAEIESALVGHPSVAQAAVVGKPHPIKGQGISAFVMLVEGAEESDALIKELVADVRAGVGPFATPDQIVVSPSLPMTRSGKIMRRVLRKIVAGEADSLGDTSTLADPSIVEILIEKAAP